MSTNENLAPRVLMRLVKELRELKQTPLEDIVLTSNEEDVTDIVATLSGPVETPFHGGEFRVRLVLGPEYPTAPPKGFFLTKIFHPNVAPEGDICVSSLKKDWKPDLGIKHALMAIRCLLICPFAESALNEEAGRLLLEDYASYVRRAATMTRVHAWRKTAPNTSAAAAAAATAAAPASSCAEQAAAAAADTDAGSSSSSSNAGNSGTAAAPGSKPAPAAKPKTAAAAGGDKKKSLKRL